MATARTPAAPRWAVALLCVMALATGCSSVGPDPVRADAAAMRFHAALADGDPVLACQLLAPSTLQEVEHSAHTSCAQALADVGLPKATTVTMTDVYGTNARVVLDDDTVFLARFGRDWKVTAAGCKPRPGLPYDCEVKGN